MLLAKKLGMTQIFNEDGNAVPVTLLEAGPCTVVQIRTPERDGYTALQLGFGQRSSKNVSNAVRVHMGDLGVFRWLREFRVDDDAIVEWERGNTVTVAQFSVGDRVTIAGERKGRGFQGVVKRHGFSGGPASHGHRHVLRTPGSIGGRFPQRVMKGMRMAGRMGAERTTIRNLRVAVVDAEKNLLAVEGGVPGPTGGLLEIRSAAQVNANEAMRQ